MSALRIVIAEDSALFRRGLELLLTAAGVDVVGSVPDAPSLLACLAETTVDVALVDIRMPPGHSDEGIRAAKDIRQRWPQIGVCLLSTYVEPVWAAALLDALVDRVGYLLKDRVNDVDALLDALARIASGGIALDPDIVIALMNSRRHTVDLARLTNREQEVLSLLAEGRSNAGIANALFLSTKTVEGHVAAIFRALELDDTPTGNRRVLAALRFLSLIR